MKPDVADSSSRITLLGRDAVFPSYHDGSGRPFTIQKQFLEGDCSGPILSVNTPTFGAIQKKRESECFVCKSLGLNRHPPCRENGAFKIGEGYPR